MAGCCEEACCETTAMLAKLQAAAAAKRQQRVEASASTIQRAWRRHCRRPAAPTATLRCPPPLPSQRRARGNRARVAMCTVPADGAAASPAWCQNRSTRTANRRKFAECSCTSSPSSRNRDSSPKTAPDELHLFPLNEKGAALQLEWSVRRRTQTLVAPPPLPARDASRKHARRRQRYSAAERSECGDPSSWRPTCAGANVPAINNDIYKMLR